MEFRIGVALKTKKAGSAIIKLREFKEDPRVCVVSILREYVKRTEKLREADSLLISLIKPHKAVHIDTIRRWIVTVMEQAGVDVKVYRAHSTRAASTSKAQTKLVPMDRILEAGMWKKESTFARFYQKKLDNADDDSVFQEAVLSTKGQ